VLHSQCDAKAIINFLAAEYQRALVTQTGVRVSVVRLGGVTVRMSDF